MRQRKQSRRVPAPRAFACAALAAALSWGCLGGATGPGANEDSYWPARDKTMWLFEGRWEDLAGPGGGGPLIWSAAVAGTAYDGQGRPVKIWRARELDGDYYFRIAGDEVWANWDENDPAGTYHRWLKLPPADGQRWEDEKYRVRVTGPFVIATPLGTFAEVYRAHYAYVAEPGRYEVWWYAAGLGLVTYENYWPGVKHELCTLTSFTPGQ